MASPVDDIKQAFDGFTSLIGEITTLVNQGPSSYPGLYHVMKEIHYAILPVAYSLLTLYFLLDFLSKSMNISQFRWESVMTCMVKLVFAKFVMENVFSFMNAIFIISSYITGLVGAAGSDSGMYNIDFSAMEAQYESMDWFEQKIFYLKMMPFEWALQGIKLVITLIVFGRLFALLVYTAIAPIPIATFIHDSLSGTGKRFIMDYAAVCLQGLIVVLACIIYNSFIANVSLGSFTGNGSNMELWKGLLAALALLLLVSKSGAWAKKMTGA